MHAIDICAGRFGTRSRLSRHDSGTTFRQVEYVVVSSVGDQQGATLGHKQLAVDETIPPDAIWIDLSQPTIEEDRKVENFVGTPVPTRSDLVYTEPLETFYAENGVRYMHASVLSEPEDTPDITGVTFVMTAGVLITVHYDPATHLTSSDRGYASRLRELWRPTRLRLVSLIRSSTVRLARLARQVTGLIRLQALCSGRRAIKRSAAKSIQIR